MLKWMIGGKKLHRGLSFSWIVSYLIVLCVPVLVSMFAFIQSQNVLRSQVADVNLLLLQQVSGQVEDAVMEIQRISSVVELSPTINNYAYISPESENTQQDFVRTIREEMDSYIYTAGTDLFMFLYLTEQDAFITPTAVYDGKAFYQYYLDQDVPYESWKETFLKREESSFFKDRFVFNGQKLTDALGYSRSVPAISLDGRKMVLGVVYNLDPYYQKLSEATLMKGGAAAVLDKNTGLLFSNGAQDFQGVLAEGYDTFDEDKDTVIRGTDGRRYITACVTSDITGWKYVYFVPEKAFLEKANHTFYVIVFSMLVIFIMGGGIIFYLVRKNYAPVRHILSLLKIEPGGQKDEFELIRERIANTIEEKNLISTALDKQNAIVRRNYLIKMLTGQINYKENISEVLAELLIPFSAEQKFVVLMLSVESYAEFFEGETALSDFEKSELVDFMFENVFTELIQHQNDTGFVLPYSGNIFCIVGGREIQLQELREMVRQGQDIFEKNFQIPFSGVISDVNTGFEGIHQAYQQVLEAGEMRMFSGEQDLVLYAEAMQRDSGDSISPLGLNAQKLEALVENGDRDGAAEYLTELMRRQEKRARVSPHAYRFFVFEIIEVLMNLTLTVYGRSDTAAALQEKLMRALDGHMNRGEYRQFFLEVLSKMCAEAGDKTKNNETVARAVRYIEGHYQDDALNISALADVLNVSSKYLSAVFKKEKNTGILDYIGKIRISKAKQLLEETYMNMEDIYKKVGFTNKITFIRIFKKWEGITPSEYRNLRRGSHV